MANGADDSRGPDTGATASMRRRKRERMPGVAALPTALTLGNAVCGVAALIELAKAYAAIETGDLTAAYLRIGYAALFIGGGMVFDALDGKVARMTGTVGRFGAELDSLCDAITFGVTPALMIRVAGELLFAREPLGLSYDSNVLWAVSALYACCAILRLARYNVETNVHDDHASFLGLPSPAAAASICALALGGVWFAERFAWFFESPWPWITRIAFPLLASLIALMMVTRVRYIHAFNRLVSRRQSLRVVVLFLVALTVIFIFRDQWKLIVPVVMLAYVLSGPIYFAYRFLRGRGLLGRRAALIERKRRRAETTKPAID